MLSRWPIRKKLTLGIALLLVTVSILAFSGFQGVYAYRELAKRVSGRASELPLTTDLAVRVGNLRATVDGASDIPTFFGTESPVACQWLRTQFGTNLTEVHDALDKYRTQLRENQRADVGSWDYGAETNTVGKIDSSLTRIGDLQSVDGWTRDSPKIEELKSELRILHGLSTDLPRHLQTRMRDLAVAVRSRYRTWIALSWVTSALATLLLCLLGRLFYTWVLQPLRLLLQGSRRVAAGDFGHRIHLSTQDEMAELANAMNQMTIRFQEVRDDLDKQVRQRTKQVVRNEQLASVGFLAAGVAHEINNPLASIALCSESLENRLHDIIQADDARPDDEHNEEISVLRNYLRMIQDEAFRCKDITEQLLDFSRLGDVERQHVDLGELVRHVVDMVGHIGKYKEKQIELHVEAPVIARVNAQEMKQVVLNLLTNALDSTDRGGTIKVQLHRSVDQAELLVSDDGCGMTPDVLEHVFEPFFTQRRDGQGTGLGLSISCRIVADHGGHIDAQSDGPGHGSMFRVLLPLADSMKEHDDRYQAA